MSFESELFSLLDEKQILRNEAMSRHTTFRVGGAADYLLQPKTEEIRGTIELCRKWEVPVTVIGNGSNLLVSDHGIRGAVIEICRQAQQIRTEGHLVYAQAGALLSQIASAACQACLTGMEFAAGIPGTVGGALVMNAGAYGGEMKDILTEASVLTSWGEVQKVLSEELELSYRHSCIAERGYIVLEAVFRLQPGRQEEILARMEELRKKRVEKQPLEYPSAGSTFKRPPGHFAGKLIEDAGLKGYRVGDAQVSEKHSGFVINRGTATAAEIWRLIKEVQDRVYETSGVRIEPEVKLLGKF
ncbi:MAG: UDP-N-acetylmuramate dehydrogenase [Eubacterium sp.]|nr:UDP-N-acetylmuramate dehydrogenase [Eubacterium sp.]